LNTNADALSRREQPTAEVTALTMTSISLDRLKDSQHSDPTITQVYNTLKAGSAPPSGRQWRYPPLHRYKKLWSQLHLVNGIVCRQYHSFLLIFNLMLCVSVTMILLEAIWDMKSHSINYTRKLTGYQCLVTLNVTVENVSSAMSLNLLSLSEHL